MRKRNAFARAGTSLREKSCIRMILPEHYAVHENRF